MVWQREGLGCTYDDVACVNKSTTKRVMDRFKLTGNVSKKPYLMQRAAHKVITLSSVTNSSVGNGLVMD